MPNSRYFIVQQDDTWHIRFRDGDFGPYRTRQEAMMFAVDAAQQLGKAGEVTEVCLVGENGHSARNGPSDRMPIRRGYKL